MELKVFQFNNISEVITRDIKTVAIVGHMRPDGDCVGSSTGLYRYLTENFPEITCTLYLETPTDNLSFLLSDIRYRTDSGENCDCDLCISTDVSSIERIGAGAELFIKASKEGKTVCIDHHETNPVLGKLNYIDSTAVSCSEIVVRLCDPGKISKRTAVCLYTGIIHDSGVFRYDATTPDTLRKAAFLIEKGIDFSKIIQDSITDVPENEMRFSAEVLLKSEFTDRVLIAKASLDLQRKYRLQPINLGGVITYLNEMKGADIVLFMYQCTSSTWKGSLRSKCDINVSEIASLYGGGGHRKAAGFNFSENPDLIADKIRAEVKERINRK